MEILADIASTCLVFYPEAAVTTFDSDASPVERIVAGAVFAFGTACLLAVAGLLAYLAIHGI